ncbi:MAG: PPC domain-containing protein [Planctomycetes bacterium]|nr:PPC domain-containing protein [Planctomycetota bacterium]
MRVAIATFLFLATASLCSAQSSYPMLMDVAPLAVQAGANADHVVTARYNLYGTYQVIVDGEGVTGEPIAEPKKDDPKKVEAKDAKTTEPPKKEERIAQRVRFTARADAQPGVREFRLVTPQGLSTVGQLLVVRDPVVAESGKNDTPEAANVVKLPAAVCGAVEAAEDVDYFKFTVEAGKTLVFHVRSARLEDKIHDLQTHVDPIIALKNSAGVVLAANDNFFFGDPLLSYTFKTAGDYFLEVRDVRYQGNKYWQYCVEINDRPLVATVMPAVVKAGTKATVELVGMNLPVGARGEVEVPADAKPSPRWLVPRMGDASLNPVPVIVAAANVVNESTAAKSTPEAAQDVAVPAIIAGRIDVPSEADRYAFAAKKGELFTFEVCARRAQSNLDSILSVYDEKGKRLVESDDVQIHRWSTSDSFLEGWAAPADGKYVVEVRDLHSRGGAGFTYGLKITRAEPYFLLHADMDKVLLPGQVGGQVFVRCVRKNGFTGEVQLSVEGLPTGVRAECGRILEAGMDGTILFYAEPGTRLSAGEVRIVGTAVHKGVDGKEIKLTATAAPWQEIYQPGGGRGHFPVDRFFVNVCEPLDIVKVKVSPTDVVLKPGESKKLEITIERAPGFDKNITLDLIYKHLASPFGNSLPAGVTIDDKQSKTLLTAKETSGHITITAAKDAKPVEKQLVPAMAQVAINFVMKMSYCGEPLRVTVLPDGPAKPDDTAKPAAKK